MLVSVGWLLAGCSDCNFHVLGQVLSYFTAVQGSYVYYNTKMVLCFEHSHENYP